MPIEPYEPPRWLANGHRMTIVTWASWRRFARLPEPDIRLFDVAPDARVLAKCHWQGSPRSRPTLLLLHGLEGSADAHYIRGMAEKAFAQGFNVVRLNQRNCGGTEHLSVGVYHSGLTADPGAVIRELIDRDRLDSISVAGYSLGGNVALKLAGEFGATPPRQLDAIAAVSPTLDLGVCIDAIERPSNWIYQQNFLVSLKRRVRRKAALYPSRYSTAPLAGLRTIRAFDDAYTARLWGFRDATDYYYRASSLRVAREIRVPTLIITAADDPFVPVEQFGDPWVTGNPNIHLVVTAHGGHCGFLARRANGAGDRYWAERAVVDFVAARAR
jgi:predicted alpha/beta-fold hydrolase